MNHGPIDLRQQSHLREAMKMKQIQDRIGNTYACAQNLFITGFQELLRDEIEKRRLSEDDNYLELKETDLKFLADISIRAAKLINDKIAEDSKHYAKIIAKEYKYVEPGSEG